MPFTPDSLRIAMVQTWSEPEPKLTHTSRRSSRPAERSHVTTTIYLLNRSDVSITAEVSTGGYASVDDGLLVLSGRTRTVTLEPRSAFHLETADEGAFDFKIWYTVTVPLPDGSRVSGTFGISLYAQRDFDCYEDDPVLGVNARIIRPRAWSPVGP